jgi:hypothetical protein
MNGAACQVIVHRFQLLNRPGSCDKNGDSAAEDIEGWRVMNADMVDCTSSRMMSS